MTKDDRAALRALATQATPGPWQVEKPADDEGRYQVRASNGLWVAEMEDYTKPKLDGGEANARHIAAADPSTLLRLLDALDEAERKMLDLACSVVAFGAPWAVEYARAMGYPDGHLHPRHYDILKEAGARMDDFTRAEEFVP